MSKKRRSFLWNFLFTSNPYTEKAVDKLVLRNVGLGLFNVGTRFSSTVVDKLVLRNVGLGLNRKSAKVKRLYVDKLVLRNVGLGHRQHCH